MVLIRLWQQTSDCCPSRRAFPLPIRLRRVRRRAPSSWSGPRSRPVRRWRSRRSRWRPGLDWEGLIAELDERSRDILASRWLSEQKATLHQLADKYGVSAERIRQLEQNAMKTFREPAPRSIPLPQPTEEGGNITDVVLAARNNFHQASADFFSIGRILG